jgi:hypothetical protein
LSADFADAADAGKEICAICVICGFPILHSALPIPHLNGSFPVFIFGWTIWAFGVYIPDVRQPVKIKILFLVTMGLLPLIAQAQFGYSVTSGAATITNYTGTGGNVTIPATLGGYPVVSIGNNAFQGSSSIKNITIPTGVTNIGASAFMGCGLTNISIPNSVRNIGMFAFANCSLTSFTFPSSMTNIAGGTFYNSPTLTNIVIQNGMISISDSAFTHCGLMSLTVPASVTSIESDSFYNCFQLMNITVAANNPDYSSLNGVLFDTNQITLVLFPLGKATTNSSYIIPASVKSISNSAFSFCVGLTSITIPAGVTNISNEAFENCTNLTTITFLGNASSLGSYAFASNYSDSGLIPATVYYYYGTSGWGTTCGGLPAVMLGAPAPQIGGSGGVSVQFGGFNFTVAGVTNQTVVVEASTNLVNWQSIWTNTLFGASTNFTDLRWTNYPARFYRFRSP